MRLDDQESAGLTFLLFLPENNNHHNICVLGMILDLR